MPGSREHDGDLTVLRHGPVTEAAPLLLGAILRHGDVAVRLTEVEAYGGADDPGSHAHRGRTARNATMFAEGGHLYCYLSYGVHVCANVVVGAEDEPAAILLRAGEIVEGLEVARGRAPHAAERDLARGPGRLCRALAIGHHHDGVRLSEGPVLLTRVRRAPPPVEELRTGPRVGLRASPERPWRYWLAGEPTVSTYRPAAVRRRR